MRNRPPLQVVARLMANVRVTPSGCIESQYSVGSHGYSQIGWYRHGRQAMQTGHRVAWMAAHGPIPAGLTVDHACHNRRCVNVDHLRLLTNQENARDNGFATRTHCPRGHEYDEANTYEGPTGGRRCRACARERQKARAA